MANIIKHGNLVKWIMFQCPMCGCEFEERKEKTELGMFHRFCKCPDCGYGQAGDKR